MNRAPKNNNHYIDLIDSESQPMPVPKKESQYIYASNTRSNPMAAHHGNNESQSSGRPLPRYDDVVCFKQFKELASLTKHYFELKDFLQNRHLNILFIFGPSGCGKSLLVQSALKANGIDFQLASPRVSETEEGELIYQDVFEMIEEVLKDRSAIRQKIIIFKEFPIDLSEAGSDYHFKYKQFRETIYEEMKQSLNHSKYIFILNTEIYSSFYLLSENSENRALNKLSNVSIMKLEAYGAREMKSILQHFVRLNPVYSSCFSDPKSYEDIILQANGDARKALNLVYHRKLYQIAPKNAPICQQFSLLGTGIKNKPRIQDDNDQQERKVTVFHMLGKFLYGKRYNIYYNPQATKKKDRGDISRTYTQQELKKYNPKFYFKPVELLDRSHMSLNVFSELLHQNFINRYGSVCDIARMSTIFRYYDSYMSESLNKFQLMQQMQQILKQLLTWGILIYNRNAIKVSNGLSRIQRCKNIMCKQLLKKKMQILKGYYLKGRDGGRSRLKDMIDFAYLTKNQRQKGTYSFLHQKLIEVVMDNRKTNQYSQIDSNLNPTQEEEQQIGKQNCCRINQLAQAIVNEVNRRSRLLALVMDDSDASDIDSEPQ